MEWIEDVFYGAVTKGVNETTVGVFRAVCIACIISLAGLLYICWTGYPELIPHCFFALTLSIFLYAIMYWFLNELGTVSPAEQRKELFGDQTTGADNQETDTTTVAAPKDSQAKKAE